MASTAIACCGKC